jgi:hypothetical protein
MIVLLPHSTVSPFGSNEVEFQVVSVVVPIRTSEVHLMIQTVGGTRINSNWEAEVIFAVGLNSVFGITVGLIAVSDCLARHGRALVCVVVALPVTILCRHEMSLWIVWTSSIFSITNGTCAWQSQEVLPMVSQMSVHSCLSDQWQLISEACCQRLNVRDPMSQTACQWLNVSIRFTILLICSYSILLRGVTVDLCIQRVNGFVMDGFPSLECSKDFSECGLATDSIYIMSHHR